MALFALKTLVIFHKTIDFAKQLVYKCFFLRKVVRQSHTDVTSNRMQFEKIGRGLLREDLPREGECFVTRKKGGNKKGSVLETGGEHWSE